MAASAGWAALQIIPTVQGVAKEVQSQIVGPLSQGGKKAGQEAGKGVADGLKRAESQVKAATAAQVKAMSAVEDQTSKVRVAELRLQELRDSGKAKASQIEAAEGRLVTERRKLNQAVADQETAETRLTAARENLDSATRKSTGSTEEAAKAAKAEADELAKVEKEAKAAEQASSDLEAVQGKLAIGFAAVVAGAGAVTGALVAVGTQFDDMYDTIRIGTGASGADMEELAESARLVADSVPAMSGGMSEIGTVMADLNTRTGATGETLEELSAQFIWLSNMGAAADINKVTAAMQGFGIAAEDAPAALDDLFRVSQATGLSIDDLAGSVTKNGAAFREMDMGLTESAALLGNLDKAGIEGDKVIQRLTRAMGEWAEAGREPGEAMRETVGEIEQFIEVGDNAAAYDLAESLFGTRGAAQFIDAVKSGTLSMDDFVDAAGMSGDAIVDLGEETADWPEKWQQFKQSAMLAVEPLATALFDRLGPALESAGEVFKNVIGWVEENKTVMLVLAGVVGTLGTALLVYKGTVAAVEMATRAWNVIQLVLNGTLRANPIGLIVTGITALIAVVVLIATKTEFFQKTWEIVWNTVKAIFTAAWDLIQAVGATVLDWLTGAWESFLGFFTGIVDRITSVGSTIWDAVTTATDTVTGWIQTAWDKVVGFFSGAADKLKSIGKTLFQPFQDGAKAVFNKIADFWNNTAGRLSFKAPSWVPGLGGKGFEMPKIPKMATGGRLPTTGPGTDVVDGFLALTSGGKPIANVDAGEWVINRHSSDKYDGLLDAINRDDPRLSALPALAGGGRAGREPYGLPVGTRITYGSPGFPEWVEEIGREFDVQASTYPGHQERSGQNLGIDWWGTVDAMQAFAEHLAGIHDQLLQVIWMNPSTGQKIGVADGQLVGPGTDQPGYFRNDWSGHQDHVHTSQNQSFDGKVVEQPVAELDVESVEPMVLDSTSSSPVVVDSTSAAPAEPEKEFSARERLQQFGSDAGRIAVDGLIDIFDIGEWLDLHDRYSVDLSDPGTMSYTEATDAAAVAASSPAVADVVSDEMVVPESEEVVRHGAEMYAYEIARVAKDMGLGERAAVIGEATALVESGDPLKMWANSSVPESLNFPHDAVGSDHDSVGLFQQRPQFWGPVADLMDPAKSAALFYEALTGVSGWESMDPGAAAQAVQRSAFPGRYAEEMERAKDLVRQTGLYDSGGILPPKSVAMNLLDEPEYVLRDAHWKTAAANIAKVDELVGAGAAARGPLVVNNNYATLADQASWQKDQADREWIQIQRYLGGLG